MRLSVHNKVRGGFDYYEAPDTTPINDDHPTPELAKYRTSIGVPATKAGRPLPRNAQPVGHGQMPVGAISSGEQCSWLSTVASATMPSGMGALFDSASGLLPGAFVGAILGAVVARRGKEATGAIIGSTIGVAIAIFGDRHE